MPTQNIHVIKEDFKNLSEASEAFAILQKQVRYLQEHIDVENIIAKSLTAAVIKAGAITAEEMTVDRLSAITSNMGKLTAGEIYGALIATKEAGNYPRIEFTSLGNLLSAQGNANDRINISPDVSGTPALVFLEDGGVYQGRQFMSLGKLIIITTSSAEIIIASGKNLDLQAGSGYYVTVHGWDKFKNNVTDRTLQQELDSINSAIDTIFVVLNNLSNRVTALENAGP